MKATLQTWETQTVQVGGCWSLRVIGDGLDLAENGDQVHPAASIIKLPILVAVLDLIRDGDLQFSDRLTLRAEDVRGSGALQFLDLDSVTVREALALMVTISDNVATNALIEHVGLRGFRHAWSAYPYEGFELNRFLGHPARTPAEDNYASADAAARCLLDLEQRAGEATARFGLALLAQQQVRDRIPSRLPADVECLNKTGEVAGVRHDVALLRSGTATVAVAMLSSRLQEVGASTGGGRAADVMGRTAAALVGELRVAH